MHVNPRFRDLAPSLQPEKMDSAEVWGEEDGVTTEVANLTAAELRMRASLVDSELKYFKSEANKLKFELNNMQVWPNCKVYTLSLISVLAACAILFECGSHPLRASCTSVVPRFRKGSKTPLKRFG